MDEAAIKVVTEQLADETAAFYVGESENTASHETTGRQTYSRICSERQDYFGPAENADAQQEAADAQLS